MDADGLLGRLEEVGLVESLGVGDELRLTDEFSVRLTGYRTRWRDLNDEGLRTEFADLVGSEVPVGALPDEILENREVVYIYAVVHDLLPDHSAEERFRLSTVLATLRGDPPLDDGAPDAFLSVSGENLPILVRSFRAAVVYFWREDCDPCDLMRETFDTMFESPPDDIGLFAVYGPDAARFLHETYNVEVAPTTLFMLDGEVDSRIIGSRFRGAIAAEIEMLRD